MKLKSFILISIAVIVLKSYEGVHCKTYHDNYKNYIERVVSHIYSQIRSYKKQDSKNATGVEEAFQPSQLLDFTYNYRCTISALNFMYTKIVKKYLYHIYVIIRKCQQFYENNSVKKFISCVIFLVKQVNNSKAMFESLYNAMKFISYIDIRFLFSENAVPHAIIDEIDFMYQFVSKENLETSNFNNNISSHELSTSVVFTKFANLFEFYNNASKRVNNLLQNSLNIIDPSIKTYLKKIETYERIKKNSSSSVCSNPPNKFYDETIDIWYKNLGFEQFLEPIKAEFIPPIDPETNQNDGIKALNIIRKESGWESMNHIIIIYYEKLYTVDYIMKDEINNINFRIKKEHVSQLIRCRYIEIIKKYRTLLSAILFVCNKDANEFYHNCLIKLFSSFNESKKMLEGLYEALITLNRSSIWSDNFSSKLSLHNILKWVSDFLRLLKTNNFYQKSFIILNDKTKTEMVEKLLEIFISYFNDFSSELHSEISIINTQCHINKPFNNEMAYITDFKNSKNISNNSDLQRELQIIYNACNYFENFCKDVYKSCYEDLGFKKVSEFQNKPLDDKLIPFTKDLST
ncbi:uncharacterized protein LOC126907928 isoform X11 [Daktulosphaira vitifoliae]|uniref:uncharacterized protein LOC126907928 isoform X11 n=1 Tax=Daktulosphaira vitifoliae TaxID=58002 RepID=UPI0021AA3E8F|nr:uncharacterized protein LOC126907928 isoform X11 [Daktulosphaira vitifoliae]